MSKPKTFYFRGLGCPKNEVDGDVIIGHLCKRGLRMVGDPVDADYLIVNTCGFIQAAKEESLEEIFHLVQAKTMNHRQRRLFVTGCLAQRYVNDLVEKIPEIDGVIGIDQYDKITDLLKVDMAYVHPPPSTYRDLHSEQIVRKRAYAYLKISDGCNNHCNYCTIPLIRGEHRSRALVAIEQDIDRYLAAGVLELNLIGQDLGRYGQDIGVTPVDLLQMIEAKAGDFWVRPYYLHPRSLSDEILDFLSSSSKFCDYLEMPIQHVNSELLRKMNRGYDREFITTLFDRIKEKLPRAALRTSLIVGFPAETEADYRQVCDFVEEYEISRGGVFGYSREEGTVAYDFPGQHDLETINYRQLELQQLIDLNADRFNQKLVGTTQSMLIENHDKQSNLLTGRLYCDAPEIDFKITVPADGVTVSGFVTVEITDVTVEGFSGRIVRDS